MFRRRSCYFHSVCHKHPDVDFFVLTSLDKEKLTTLTDSNLQIFLLVTIILIYIINGVLINFIMKQSKRSEMDSMMLMHSILCILNTFFIIRTSFSFTENTEVCLCFTLLGYWVNSSNRLLDMGIVIYRYVLVVKHIVVHGPYQRKLLSQKIFFTIFWSSAIFTGYAAYFKDTSEQYLSKEFLQNRYLHVTPN